MVNCDMIFILGQLIKCKTLLNVAQKLYKVYIVHDHFTETAKSDITQMLDNTQIPSTADILIKLYSKFVINKNS